MDLALALVEQDEGREVALDLARNMVLFLRRPGGQSQFSAQLAVQAADRQPLRDLQAWIGDHLDADLSVPTLARRAAMSPRHFARVFTAEVGATPARFVEGCAQATRRRLEESSDGVEQVADRLLSAMESMRKAPSARLRVPPSAYR
jgi:transcriptional regulator GlxA family with amidase domain